jgi:hypothetical protein
MRNCRPAVVEPGPAPLLLAFNLGPATDEARQQARDGASTSLAR